MEEKEMNLRLFQLMDDLISARDENSIEWIGEVLNGNIPPTLICSYNMYKNTGRLNPLNWDKINPKQTEN